MENLADPLILLIFVKRSLDRGESVRAGVEQFIQNSSSPWRVEVQNWLSRRDLRLENEKVYQKVGLHRRILLETIDRGLEGQSILPTLATLQDELVEVCEMQIHHHTQTLPFKLMIPLFVFILPSFLILLFGPLIL